eukprot:COSAG05_NODE_4102_length_1673_cov_2.445997_2_plen_334_part_01
MFELSLSLQCPFLQCRSGSQPLRALSVGAAALAHQSPDDVTSAAGSVNFPPLHSVDGFGIPCAVARWALRLLLLLLLVLVVVAVVVVLLLLLLMLLRQFVMAVDGTIIAWPCQPVRAVRGRAPRLARLTRAEVSLQAPSRRPAARADRRSAARLVQMLRRQRRVENTGSVRTGSAPIDSWDSRTFGLQSSNGGQSVAALTSAVAGDRDYGDRLHQAAASVERVSMSAPVAEPAASVAADKLARAISDQRGEMMQTISALRSTPSPRGQNSLYSHRYTPPGVSYILVLFKLAICPICPIGSRNVPVPEVRSPYTLHVHRMHAEYPLANLDDDVDL